MTPPIALSIAGSDSSGGADIQADPKFVVDHIEAVLDDLAVAAVKTGMLATPAIVSAIAELAEAGRLPKLVIDPAMVASSGDRLLQLEAESLYVEALLPHASMLTPNLREAEVLLGTPIRCLPEQREAAHALGALGPAVVVIKGGHPGSDSCNQAVDVVWDGTSTYDLSAPRVDTVNNHGTGCTFAAAAAAAMAGGAEPADALKTARDYVSQALSGGASLHLGHGHGPLDHFAGAHR